MSSYRLEILKWKLLSGEYNARRLREFIPREGTELAVEQKDFEAALREKKRIARIECQPLSLKSMRTWRSSVKMT